MFICTSFLKAERSIELCGRPVSRTPHWHAACSLKNEAQNFFWVEMKILPLEIGNLFFNSMVEVGSVAPPA